MYAKLTLIACLAGAVALPAISQTTPEKAPPLPPDTPLVVDGDVRVEAADFEGNILRIPEDKRGSFRISFDRVAGVIDNIYVTRSMAQKARAAGLDRDPAVQARLKQLQDAFLAELYLKKLEKDGGTPDFDQRARELYTVDKATYLTDEEAHVQQILVGTGCRTKEAAREIALRAYEEARDGKSDFLALAEKYADVGEKAPKGGDIGSGPVKRLVAPVREALTKMKEGAISEPVESQFGFHVLKLVARTPAQPKPYDAVKEGIIAAERSKLQRKRVEDALATARSSTTVITYRDNIAKLVATGTDLEELTRKAREAQAAQAAPGAQSTPPPARPPRTPRKK